MLIVASVVGCASTEATRDDSQLTVEQLGGEWLLTMPAGFERPVNIEPLPPSHVVIASGGNLAGKYELNRHRMVVVDPSTHARRTRLGR